MNEDQLREQANRLEELAMLLFEQQFIRHGGRKPADPEWEDFWQLTSNVHRLYVMSLHKEIDRLRREVEFEANAVQTGGEWFGFEEPRRVCCCLTPEGAALVAADPRWSLPQCSVHPDRGGNTVDPDQLPLFDLPEEKP